MAGECTETTNPLAPTSSIHNWWPLPSSSQYQSSWISTNTFPNWQFINSELNNNNNNNNNNISSDQSSSGEESGNLSTSNFTNASNHSGLSVESSRRSVLAQVDGNSSAHHEFIGETAPHDNHLWNNVIIGGGNNGDMHNTQDFAEQLLNEMSSKSLSAAIFDPACDYTKKIDNSNWLSSSMEPFNNFEKQKLNTSKLSNFVGNWSQLSLQDHEHMNQQFAPRRSDIVTQNAMMKEPFSDLGQGKQSIDRILGSISCFGHDMKMAPEEFGRSSFDSYKVGNPIGLSSKYSYELPNMISHCSNSRSLTEALSSVERLSRRPFDTNLSKPIFKTLDLSGFKKQVFQTSQFPTPKSTISTYSRNTRRSQVQLSGGKKKRSEENPDTVVKKPRQEASTISTAKLQVPKAKLADKITALQQIVSPFGKTDTASVLWEAIGYVRFLQEQIQLLSIPYMKGNSSKEHWGGLDRKERGEAKMDLRSRGLCLVPISSTPQACRENNGSDYLTPMYRGCLYR